MVRRYAEGEVTAGRNPAESQNQFFRNCGPSQRTVHSAATATLIFVVCIDAVPVHSQQMPQQLFEIHEVKELWTPNCCRFLRRSG